MTTQNSNEALDNALRRIDESIVTVDYFKDRIDEHVYQELMSALQDHWMDDNGNEVRSRLQRRVEELASAVSVGAAQNDALARADAAEQRVMELREAGKGALRLCRDCDGSGTRVIPCTMCHDSTWDHHCNDREVPCGIAACIRMLVLTTADGPKSLWVGKDCAKTLFGFEIKGDVVIEGGKPAA